MKHSTEIWREVKGYEGIYEVSNFGMVRSLDRIITRKNSTKLRIKGSELGKTKNSDGYNVFAMCKNRKKINKTVHRAVAETFIPNYENKKTVNHKNGIKTDNRVENLEWMTQKENVQHAWATGLAKIDHFKKKIIGTNLETRKNTEFESAQDAGRFLKTNPSHISACARGVRKTAYGYTWEYA